MNYPFDRTVINARERPMSLDHNRNASELDYALRDVLLRLYLARGAMYPDGAASPITGMIGECLKVRPFSPASMSVYLKAGIGFYYDPLQALDIGGVSGVNDLSQWKPLVLTSDKTIAVPAAPGAPNARYDIIEVRTNRALIEPTSRDVLNAGTGVFEPNVVNKSLSWQLDSSIGQVADPANSTAAISLKVGAASATPVEPTTTTGYTRIATIYVGSAITSLDADVIRDERRILGPAGYLDVAANVHMNLGSDVPIMNALQAPPGVVMSAVGEVVSTQFALYVFAGQPTIGNPAIPTYAAYYGPSFDFRGIQVAPTQITVDSSLQASLVGAKASPQIKVAVGQRGWCIRATCVSAPGAYGIDYLLNAKLTV